MKRTPSRKQHLNLPEINIRFYKLGLLERIYLNSDILDKSAVKLTSIFPASRKQLNVTYEIIELVPRLTNL